MQNRKNAFTLIELLVVLAILGILAAVLLPVLAKARQKSYQATCISNLGQIGKAIGLYAADYESYLPLALDIFTYKKAHETGDYSFPENYGIPLSAEEVKALPDINTALKPYGVVHRLWHCPADQIDWALKLEGGHKPTFYEDTGSSYRYNEYGGLKHFALSSYSHPSEATLIWDDDPFHFDNFRDVLFIDLHVKGIENMSFVKYNQSTLAEEGITFP